jgi:sugar phosphate isomerase/epimerase
MSYPITLCTSQWVDLPLEELAKKASNWGLDGLELTCGGDHFNVQEALQNPKAVDDKKALLEDQGLYCQAIANHLVGQCVSDPIDTRHKTILPERIWGDGVPEGVQARAAQEMMDTARAASKFGVPVVTGFTGSPVWHMIYPFPPTPQALIDEGYKKFAEQWLPILDVFAEENVLFALEVHPTEIAFDIHTMHRAFEALDWHPAFGINFDPSHLVPQFVDPLEFLYEFPDRIFHVHIKDSRVQLNGRNSILGSHLPFGNPKRGWDFVSPGRGDIDWDAVVRALNQINYQGPLSIEWEDSGMERERGVQEALVMVQQNNFSSSDRAFDADFGK